MSQSGYVGSGGWGKKVDEGEVIGVDGEGVDGSGLLGGLPKNGKGREGQDAGEEDAGRWLHRR